MAWASATTGFVALCLLTSLALFALLEKKWGMDFQIYRLGRTILVASIWIFLLHDAFQQSILFGALGLFPPFLLVYGALYTESSLLKGAFFALILWLGIEVLLIENRSYYAAMQLFIQQVIDGGNHWINHTSRS